MTIFASNLETCLPVGLVAVARRRARPAEQEKKVKTRKISVDNLFPCWLNFLIAVYLTFYIFACRHVERLKAISAVFKDLLVRHC